MPGDLGQQHRAQGMLLQQVPKIEDRRLIGPRVLRREAHEALHRRAVVERVLHRRVAEVIEQLHAMNSQHHGQGIGWPPALAGGVHRAEARFQPPPRNQAVHLLQKLRPSRLALLPLVLHIGE